MSESILPNYSFLPWLRRGIGNKLTEVEDKGAGGGALERGKVDVKLKLSGDGTEISTLDKEVSLISPGDIRGINMNAIVKTIPADREFDFEPNYLPGIEFYDEDFLWRYTPAQPNESGQLRPWITLFVLKEDEFSLTPPTSDSLPVIEITVGALAPFLPKLDEMDTWAHVQVNDDLKTDGADTEAYLEKMMSRLSENPDLGICRLLCPRKLETNTHYQAFLVPTYETGRLAGLNFASDVISLIEAQKASWGSEHNPDHEPNRWPIYHTWTFRTGEAGDFEYLVRQLKPRMVSDNVGRRDIDLQDAGYGLKYEVTLPSEEAGEMISKTTIKLEGALKVPGTESEGYPYLDASDAIDYASETDTDFRKQLQDILNLEEDLKDPGGIGDTGNYYGIAENTIAGSGVEDDPVIVPPLYGRWHIAQNMVSTTNTDATDGTANWFNELNLDPRNRIAASLGASIVEQKQDTLMDQAWGQLGDVVEANKKLVLAQFATETSNAMYKKHLASQPDEKALGLTGKMKRRVVNEGTSKTYFSELKESRLPNAVEDKFFRRVMRPKGPVMKRIDPDQEINSGTDNLVSRMDKPFADLLKATAAIAKELPGGAVTSPASELADGVGSVTAISTGAISFSLAGIGAPSVGDDTLEKSSFKLAVSNFNTYFDGVNWVEPVEKPEFDLTKVADVKGKLAPKLTMHSRVYKSIVLDSTPEKIRPVMAHPVFRQPMYEAVRDLDTNWLIPNLNEVPMNTIALLETNQKFVESFMVGLNHEMARELLWREYPTDQRGTYFQQFWNISDHVNSEGVAEGTLETQLYDIPKIHTWTKDSKLGEHNNRSEESNLVLLIRGDLLKKYPNAIIYAVEAEWEETDGLPDYSLPRKPKDGTEMYPVFNAKVEPDITFIGFEITESQAKGDDPLTKYEEVQVVIDAGGDPATVPVGNPGYFFVLKERVGEIRFGLDIAPDEPSDSFPDWNDLHWGRITSSERIEIGSLVESPELESINDQTIEWSATMNAAEMAMILYQNPVKVSVHAREMLVVPTE